MKTAVIYARYSSDNQNEQSIDGQLRVCREYAQKNGILILDTYVDRAMTGTNDNRPDFQRMLKDSARHKWEIVLVYKLDRFSRNKYETAIHKKTLRDNGVKVVSATENIPDTPEGIIMESLLEGMSQYYSAELSQKIKRGMKDSRLKGKFTGGFVVYGYKVENGKIAVDEQQAEAVRYIFEQYLQCVSVPDIIDALTARGCYFRGKKFIPSNIHYILRNRKYIGKYYCKGDLYENVYPQIVPTETFELVRKKIDLNKRGSNSVESVYLFRNILKCGYCGCPMHSEGGKAYNGSLIRYYKCDGRRKHNGCTKSLVRKDFLEKFILDRLIEQLSEPTTQNFFADKLMEIQEKMIKANTTAIALTKAIRQTESSINNMLTAIEQGGTSPSAMSRVRELEAKRDDLQKQLVLEKAKADFKIPKADIIRFIKDGLEKEPVALVEHFIKEIALFEDKAVICFKTPAPINPDESRGFSFYDEVVKMPHYVIGTHWKLGEKDVRLIMRV